MANFELSIQILDELLNDCTKHGLPESACNRASMAKKLIQESKFKTADEVLAEILLEKSILPLSEDACERLTKARSALV